MRAALQELTRGELRGIKRGNLEARIKRAICILNNSGVIGIGAKTIAVLVSGKDLEISSVQIKKFVRERYGHKFHSAKEDYGFDIPLLQPIREELGLYDGNLYDAKKVYWNGLTPSSYDFLRNVRIPLSVDKKLAELLGIIWAEGRYELNENTVRIHLDGKEKDLEVYDKRIRTMIKDIFNLVVNLQVIETTHMVNGKIRSYHNPRLSIVSKAINSWLINYAGFPKDRENMDLPRVKLSPENAEAFYKGLFMGMMTKHSKKYIALSCGNYKFMSNLLLLARELFGVNPHIISGYNNNYRLLFSQRDQRKLEQFAMY
ncbi:MAG: hypothetical protein AABY07_07190 [Nanoarchaeota archaeon]